MVFLSWRSTQAAGCELQEPHMSTEGTWQLREWKPDPQNVSEKQPFNLLRAGYLFVQLSGLLDHEEWRIGWTSGCCLKHLTTGEKIMFQGIISMDVHSARHSGWPENNLQFISKHFKNQSSQEEHKDFWCSSTVMQLFSQNEEWILIIFDFWIRNVLTYKLFL